MNFAIVTPSFNKAPYLRRCLDSVLGQNRPDVDFWLLDNCSTDGSAQIIEEYRRRHVGRLNVIVEKDKGQSSAINRGFSLARGEIMAWLNADDFYVPNTFSIVERFFLDHPDVDLVYGHARIYDGEFKQIGIFPVQPPNLKILLSYDYICQPTAFWRRRAWDAVGPIDESLNWGMDWEFFIRITKQFRTAKLDEVLAEVVMDGQHKTATGGIKKTRELARISRRHGGWWQPTNLFCQYVIALNWLTAPWAGRPATQRFREKMYSYATTAFYRLLGAQVMC
jgi:glycosyltransferase involved in cell wall biosynthesis